MKGLFTFFLWNNLILLWYHFARADEDTDDQFVLPSSLLDLECPPLVIPSYKVLEKYPACGSRSRFGNEYSCSKSVEDETICDDEGRNCKTLLKSIRLCEGTIDESMTVLPCSRNISSCEGYYEVCEELPHTWSLKDELCNASGHVFSCWDMELDAWCDGYLEPVYGSWENPACPLEAVKSCQDLATYGIDSGNCTCVGNGGEGFFACTLPNETLCEGRISETGGCSFLVEGSSACHQSDRIDECPPLVAEDLDMVDAFCAEGWRSWNAQEVFTCSDGKNAVCVGKMLQGEENQLTPPCTYNISSCDGIGNYDDEFSTTGMNDEQDVSSVLQYYHTCTDKIFHSDYLTSKCGVPGPNGELAFRCWDKFQDRWCQGYITTDDDDDDHNNDGNEDNRWCPKNITGHDYPDKNACSGTNSNFFGFGKYTCNFPGGYQCSGQIVPEILEDKKDGLVCPPPVVTSWDDVRLFCSTDFICDGTGDGGLSMCSFSDCTSCPSDDGRSWRTGHFACSPRQGDNMPACAGIVNVSADVVPLDLPMCSQSLYSCTDEEYYTLCDDPVGRLGPPNCTDEDERFSFAFLGRSCSEQWAKDREAMKDCDSQGRTFRCRPKDGGPICQGLIVDLAEQLQASNDDDEEGSIAESTTSGQQSFGDTKSDQGLPDDATVSQSHMETSLKEPSASEGSGGKRRNNTLASCIVIIIIIAVGAVAI